MARICLIYDYKTETSFRAEQASGRLLLEKVQHPESSQHLNTLEIYTACLKLTPYREDSLANRSGSITSSKKQKRDSIKIVHND